MVGHLRICIRNAYDGTPQVFYPVVVIGAGPSGIATACRLKQKCGFDQFRIFDRQDGIGGTWWANRYPGVVSRRSQDILPTVFYSFSFAPNYHSRTIFPTGREYVEYLHSVAERAELIDKIQLNTEVISMEWIEQDAEWELWICHRNPERETGTTEEQSTSHHGKREEVIRAKVVISAVGILSKPNEWPADVPNRDAFDGQILHSSQWPVESDLDEKDIVLVGSACSAAQIAPALLRSNIKSLTHIIRTPPWFVPRMEEPGGEAAYAKWAPWIYSTIPGLGFLREHVRLRQQAEASCLAHMRALAPAKYHAMLTPTYSLGSRRRIFDNNWLKSMSDPRYTLTNRSLLSVQGTEVTVGSKEPNPPEEPDVYHADVLILATGFNATPFLQSVAVHGRQGLSMHGIWATRGGAHAYMGTAMDGFPNFFMIMGPNTFVGHTSAIMSIENNIDYVLRLIQPVLRGDVESLEPKATAVQSWLHDIRRDMKDTLFEGCPSWYNGNGAYNSVMYPLSNAFTTVPIVWITRQ
ncbi:hypothetical protein BDV28DRAFT_165050 [Aspergillus coremiiformis]|uniref:L-ornithine N(5)-monooxygenase n=1 Tax=Aspergillus coremiiformis TaxID=138285 RepID=A0A5N6Z8T6_9EURO|nr:hypothetical protein BDV28DRAFT_165050 [Aspergillus coremiiformis]